MEGGNTFRIFRTSLRIVFLSNILIISTGINHKVTAISGYYFGKTIQSANTVKKIRSFTEVSIKECTDECRKRANCHYVDYLTRFKVCYILNTTGLNEDFESLYQNKFGSVVGVKTKWSMNNMTTVHPPSESECGEPDDIPNSTRKGNMYTNGSKVLFECTDSSDHAFSTCTALGTWEALTLLCNPLSDAVSLCQQNTDHWTVGTSCYTLVLDNQMNGAEAKAKCEELHGHLADITSQSVQDAFELHLGQLLAASKFQNTSNVYTADWMYISVNDHAVEGLFQLSDGSNVTYTNWYHDDPSTGSVADREDCVVMGPLYAYQWADVDCDRTFMAICEYN